MVLLVLALHFLLFRSASKAAVPEHEKNPEFWQKMAKEMLQTAQKMQPIVGVAKNVVLFIGDGMGPSTVTAGRILAGQMQGGNGEEYVLSFEKFPHVALAKTYNVDYQTPDSAGTATAFMTGIKSRFYMLGLDANAKFGNCSSTKGREVDSIVKWSSEKGKATGLVTTTRITHATTAAAYAHTPLRDWEGYVPEREAPCKDIAYQLVHNNNINVLMGGGRQFFLPTSAPDPEVNVTTNGRRDKRDLIAEWMQKRSNESARFKYVWNQTEFNAVNPEDTDYLLGLFNPSHMEYEIDRLRDVGGEPSLQEMTEKAIEILRRNPKGFFLLVEGGRIDQGHHDNLAAKALYDTVAFADAVAKAVEMLDPKDTLIVVSADHSHVFNMGGYQDRGNPILGLVNSSYGLALAKDGKPYTTLVYGNGPGYSRSRANLTFLDAVNPKYKQEAAVPLDLETHGGEDVAIYARGPMAHLFHGVHEQHYIAHVMAFASCVGNYTDADHCIISVKMSSSKRLHSFEYFVLLVVVLVNYSLACLSQ